jgi:hypothetical protein
MSLNDLEFGCLSAQQQAKRRAAMLEVVGLWKDRAEVEDAESFIRNLREDDWQERLNGD